MANNDSTKRVPLELLCMLILKEGDRYGYEMVQEIESRSGGLLSFNLASAKSAGKSSISSLNSTPITGQ